MSNVKLVPLHMFTGPQRELSGALMLHDGHTYHARLFNTCSQDPNAS